MTTETAGVYDPLQSLLGDQYAEYKNLLKEHADQVQRIKEEVQRGKDILKELQDILGKAAQSNGSLAQFSIATIVDDQDSAPVKRRGRLPKEKPADSQGSKKRGRGRPRKTEVVAAPAKRRGRPPKSAVAARTETSTAVEEKPVGSKAKVSPKVKEIRRQNPILLFIHKENISREEAIKRLDTPKGTLNALLAGKYRPTEGKLKTLAAFMGREERGFINEFYKWHDTFLDAVKS